MKNIFPSNRDLEKAVLEAIKTIGGEVSVKEVNKKVIELLQLPEEVVLLEDENGIDTKLNYRLRWCRTILKNQGLLTNVKRGYWALPEE